MQDPPAATSNPARSGPEFGAGHDGGDRRKSLDGSAHFGEGLVLFLGALVLLILVGGLTQRLIYGTGAGRAHAQQLGPLGIAFTELVAILVPATLFVRLRRRRGADLPFMQLSVSPSRLRGFLLGASGGALLGIGVFYVLSVFIEPLLEHFIPVPPEERAHLLRLLRPASGLRPLWQDLLCFAAVPALCEELLFRGAIFSTLGVKATRAEATQDDSALHPLNLRALLVSAALFGIFHLSPSKIFPTALLGVGFGFAALLGRSLWPAIIMHFTNNALVVVLIRAGLEEVPPGGALRLVILSLGALAAVALGVLLLRSSIKRPKPTQVTDQVLDQVPDQLPHD